MNELKLKMEQPASKLNTYNITVVGKYNDMLPYETNTTNVEADRMNDFVILFLAYMGNRNWRHTWNDCKFGEDFKHGPLQTYLGAFTADCHYPCICLFWNDIISVKLTYIDNNSNYYECELPNVEEMFESEDEFLKILKTRFDEFNKNDKRDIWDDGTEGVDSYELELVRDILRSTGKWDNKEIDNLFWINSDIGFNSLTARISNDSFLKILNQEYAKSSTNVEYSGFKPETFEKIQNTIMNSELPDETKTFVVDILGKYNKENILTPNEKKDFKEIIDSFNILNAQIGWIGPDGWSGIHISHVIEPDSIDLDDYTENEVIKYNGEIYIIHEGD